jgi:ribokinase
MSERLALLTVGSITLFDHMLPTPALPAAGDAVLLERPAGETSFGGCGLNQAMAAATLGFASGACLVAGEDFVTSGYRDAVVAAGVDVSGVTTVPGERSGHSYLVYDGAGDSFLLVEMGAARLQAQHAPPADAVRSAAAVILCMPFDRYCERAAELAREQGALVVASGQLMTAAPEVQRRMLRYCTHIACNVPERAALQRDHGCDLRELVGESFAGAWVTDGARGVHVVAADGGERFVPAARARALVDPIGAGDAFVGTATAALTSGAGLVEAARVGAVVASFVVERHGCQSNLPDWDAVVRRHREAYGAAPPPLRRGAVAAR